MLGVALCCAIAIQAFLSAFEVTITVTQTTAPDDWLTICHGAGSDAPSNRDTGNGQKLPCVLCALAGAASALLSDPVALATVPLLECEHTQFPCTLASICQRPARAGLSRGPPSFA
jgi:hypothetical protein